MPLEVLQDGAALRGRVLRERAAGKRVGLVPTMGALHAGHLSLVAAAREECGVVAATIFVNPTQFAPGEDLDQYPRDLERDRRLLSDAGCDLLFTPSVEAMYPPGSETRVDVGSAARALEGESRPTHFAGVATIVLKLLHLAPADRAYFGRKDYQQTVVLRRMVRDLDVPIDLRICPIVRDADGLALSSRNAYLSAGERRRALALSRSLKRAERLRSDEGERDVGRLRRAIEQVLAAEGLRADYVAFLKEGTLEPVATIEGPTVIALAVPVGEIRLLDNTLIE